MAERPILGIVRAIAIGLVLAVLATVSLVRVLGPSSTASITGLNPGGIHVGERARGSYRVGRHTIVIGDDEITISHPRSAGFVWASPRSRAFLGAGHGEETFGGRGGMTRVTDKVEWTHINQTLDGADVDSDDRLVLSGTLEEEGADSLDYQMFFSVTPFRGEQLDVSIQVIGEVDRVALLTRLDPQEQVHGLGAQFAPLDLRGRVMPVLPRLQGVVRGTQPLSLLVDLFTGVAGAADTTPAPLPFLLTSTPRSVWVRSDALLVADLRSPGRMNLTTWSSSMEVTFGVGASPAQHVAAHARSIGLPGRVPAWIGEGLVVGLSGGAQVVREQVRRLQQADIPVAGVVISDWSQGAPASLGKPAYNDLDPDPQAYPDWAELVEELADDGVRVLVTVSPWLAGDALEAGQAAEAMLVSTTEAPLTQPLTLEVDGTTIAPVDVADLEGLVWFSEYLQEHALSDGVAGIVAIGGEDIPLEAASSPGVLTPETLTEACPAVLVETCIEPSQLAPVGEAGLDLRLAYPADLAGALFNALHESSAEEGGVLLQSSASLRAQASVSVFTAAAQTVDFSSTDGLRSALQGMLSAGLSGMPLIHHLIGGSTSLRLPGPLPDVARTPELAVRSAELAAFTTMMRIDTPAADALGVEVTDPAVLAQLADLVGLFQALGPERTRLTVDAAESGLPVLRHPILVVPEQPEVAYQDDIAFLGDDLLVAPVMTQGVVARAVTLPAGSWVDIWTGERVDINRNAVTETMVPAPLGRPPAWARAGSAVAADLERWRADVG